MTQIPTAVFLSYASQDAEAARRICDALCAGGVEVWFDKSELRGGDAWDQKIRQQVQDCALFIPVISANTQSRQEGYFRLEWRLADQRTHLMSRNKSFIVPVVIDATADTGADAPESFSLVQWTRLPAGDTPPTFVARIRELLHRQPASAGAAAPKAEYRASPAAPATRGRGARRPLTLLAIAVLTVIVGYFALDKLQPRKPAMSETAASSRDIAVSAPSAVAPSAGPQNTDKSVAVLPFLDMSERKDQEYFSDGLSEELIDLLAKTPGLEVIARTSSFYFKGRQATIAEIAKTLNVANIIEGSVRKSGNTLRVTAQLIRTSDGVHLWSETYDRNLKDVFQVQDDIARGVVDKLKLTLLAPAGESITRTQSPQAHILFLEGLYFIGRDTEDALTKALGLFQQARDLDPNYAAAWAAEGMVAFRRVANGFVKFQEGVVAARGAATKALELDPDSSGACNVLGNVLMMTSKWQEADTMLAKCRHAHADNSDLLLSSAVLARQLGRDAESLALFQQTLERDPLNPFARRYFARSLLHMGRLREAESAVRQLLDINPTQPAAHYQLGVILLFEGDAQGALAAVQLETAIGWKSYGSALGYWAAHREAEADAFLKDMLDHEDGSQFQLAETYAYRGDADAAFRWLDAAINHDSGLIWIRGDPLLKSIESDPRYARFLRKINLALQ